MDLNTVAFRRYPSFQNHYKQRVITWLKDKLATEPTNRFIATEKLHGSNFAIYCNGHDIRLARRNGFLDANENFHNGPAIAASLKANLLDAYTAIAATDSPENGDTFYVIFYGELFGGSVQQGIAYGDAISFRAFDISIETDQSRRFLDYDRFKQVADQFELPTVPVMAEGTLDEMLALNAKFQSTILAGHEGENAAEGYVLKFHKESAHPLDDVERLMIKYKNPKFDEIAAATKKKPGDLVVGDAAEEFLAHEFATRLTFMRLQAVKSKLTTKQAKNRTVLSDELYKDAVNDLDEVSAANEQLSDVNVVAKAKKLAASFVGQNMKLLSLTASEYEKMEKYVASAERVDQAELDRLVAAGELAQTFHIPELRKVLIGRIEQENDDFSGLKGALVGVVNQKVMEIAKELVGMKS